MPTYATPDRHVMVRRAPRCFPPSRGTGKTIGFFPGPDLKKRSAEVSFSGRPRTSGVVRLKTARGTMRHRWYLLEEQQGACRFTEASCTVNV